MITRRAAHLLLPLVVLVASVAAACASDAPAASRTPTATALIDPAQPGPYAVGLRHITFERPSNADGSPRVMDTWVWYPAEGVPGSEEPEENAAPASSGGPFPIVIYSHGSGGQPNYQSFMTVHLASHGFVVAAPPHPGNTSADCFPCSSSDILVKSARERPTDVTFVLDQMIALHADESSDLGRIIDPERTAIVGHSFGGWTALYVAPESRFDAVVAHAPGLPQVLVGGAPKVTVPLMLIASGRDGIVDINTVTQYWDALGDIAKEYVTLPEGTHLSYIDRCGGCDGDLPEARGHELIRRYTTAFLYVHILGDPRYEQFLAADLPDATVLR